MAARWLRLRLWLPLCLCGLPIWIRLRSLGRRFPLNEFLAARTRVAELLVTIYAMHRGSNLHVSAAADPRQPIKSSQTQFISSCCVGEILQSERTLKWSIGPPIPGRSDGPKRRICLESRLSLVSAAAQDPSTMKKIRRGNGMEEDELGLLWRPGASRVLRGTVLTMPINCPEGSKSIIHGSLLGVGQDDTAKTDVPRVIKGLAPSRDDGIRLKLSADQHNPAC
ncbi:hypothetical protein B0H13DRAFT_1896569 [Mycena leptocephala]|nr:hypothetical protein B0H13DRAFT_1896569 [Mycena leptocephala]